MGFIFSFPVSFVRVSVIGAGPAGLFLAYRLASEDEPVIVYERSRTVGNKVCSGLLSANTVRRFGLQSVARFSVDGARVHAGSEEFLVRRKNVAYVFDRTVLDGYLYDLALSAGADVRLGSNISQLPSADVVVGADGSGSFVRRVCLGSMVHTIPGTIAYVRGSFDRYVDVFLDRNLASGFFAWLIPRAEDEAELGLAVDSKYAPSILHRLRAFAQRLGFTEMDVRGVRPIVVSLPLLHVVRRNCALVGDAAAQVKATTGGGISYGLLAADRLADAILTGNLDSYQRWHRYWVVPRLFVHYLIRRWLNRVNSERLVRVLREKGVGDALSRAGDMDDPAFLLNPSYFGLISQIVSPFSYTRRR